MTTVYFSPCHIRAGTHEPFHLHSLQTIQYSEFHNKICFSLASSSVCPLLILSGLPLQRFLHAPAVQGLVQFSLQILFKSSDARSVSSYRQHFVCGGTCLLRFVQSLLLTFVFKEKSECKKSFSNPVFDLAFKIHPGNNWVLEMGRD